MDTEQKHYPPGAEPETPAEAPPAETPEEAKAPEPEQKPDPEKPAEDKKGEPEKEQPTDENPPPEPTKKRSIYDDLKDERGKRKSAETLLAETQNRVTELEALLADKGQAETPVEKKEAKDAIDEWAEKNGLDAKAVRELTDLISSRLPTQELPISKEEVEALRGILSRTSVEAEDRAVLAEAPNVRKQFEEFGVTVHDETEFQAVMAEVVKLSHTKEFHDKPVDYIVYANRAKLKEMISPKKPSFEQGGQSPDAAIGADEAITGKTSPERAMQIARSQNTGSKTQFTVRSR